MAQIVQSKIIHMIEVMLPYCIIQRLYACDMFCDPSGPRQENDDSAESLLAFDQDNKLANLVIKATVKLHDKKKHCVL